jgi:hypothetical protein
MLVELRRKPFETVSHIPRHSLFSPFATAFWNGSLDWQLASQVSPVPLTSARRPMAF